jgi:outer membrane immunogenic protein
MKKVLLAGLALGLMPTFAVAADLGPYPRSGSVKDAPPPVYYNTVASWQGLYAGIQGGYGWGDTNASTLFGSVNNYSYSTDGFVGGIHAGYNWQVDRLVFGVESDLEASNISGSGSFVNNSHTTDVDWLGSVRARFGIAADRTLFYATGGLAYGDVHENELLPGSDGTVFRTGWTVGAGIEQQISRGLTARIEYRYTDLGSSTNTFNGVTDTNDTTFGAVRAGLSWKF